MALLVNTRGTLGWTKVPSLGSSLFISLLRSLSPLTSLQLVKTFPVYLGFTKPVILSYFYTPRRNIFVLSCIGSNPKVHIKISKLSISGILPYYMCRGRGRSFQIYLFIWFNLVFHSPCTQEHSVVQCTAVRRNWAVSTGPEFKTSALVGSLGHYAELAYYQSELLRFL